MAVQIPKVDRFNPQQPESVGRVEAKAPNAAAANQPIVQGVSNVLEAVDKYQRQVADTTGIQARSEYDNWYNSKLYGDSKSGQLGLVHQKGDVTKAYNDFDLEAEQKFNEIKEKYGSGSSYSKASVERHLINAQNSLYDKRLTAFGNQSAIYDAEVHESATKNEVETSGESVALFDGKNASTLAPFNKKIDNIEQYEVGLALKQGRIQPAKEGEKANFTYIDSVTGQTVPVVVDVVTAEKMAKNTSQATFNAISTLINKGEIEKAKIIREKYDTKLDDVNKLKLDAKINDGEVELGAYNAVSKIMRTESLPDQEKILKAMPERTLNEKKVKEKALDLWYSEDQKRDNIRIRDSKETYNKLAITAENYSTFTDFERSEDYKNLIDRVTDAKQREALKAIYDKPKESDPEVLAEMFNLTKNRGFSAMDYGDFALKAKGLNKSDTRMFQSFYHQDSTETTSAERSKMSAFHTEFANAAIAAKYLKADNPKSRREFLQDESYIYNYMLDNPASKDWTKQEMRVFADKYYANKAMQNKESAFDFTKPSTWFGRSEPKPVPIPEYSTKPKSNMSTKSSGPNMSKPEATPTPVLPTGGDFKSLSTSEKTKVIGAYIKETGIKQPKAEDLIKWYKEKGK